MGEVAHHRGELITRDGIRLHCTSRGSGASAIVVPGAWMLREALGLLAGRQTVVFYDMRSRGRSDRVDEPERLGFRLDVRDVEDVRRHFRLERMALVGFSYLGGVAARYAMAHPERVSRLVLLGAIPPRSPAPYTEAAPEPADILGPERVRRLRALREEDGGGQDPAVRCRAYWRAMLPLYTASAEAAERLAGDLDLGCELPNERPAAFERVLARVTRDLETYDWRPEARSLEVPTLVLHGASDHVAPVGGAREWATILPEARLVEVEDAGHLLWAEETERVRRLVGGFLTPEDDPGEREDAERGGEAR